MKRFMTAHTIRNSIVSLAAVAAVTLPLITSAATATKANVNYGLLNTEKRPVNNNDPVVIYARLESLSHDICGSSDFRITGNVGKSAKVEQCYEGTLTAAVQRLDNPEVTQLHRN